jgi:hypothetical protein
MYVTPYNFNENENKTVNISLEKGKPVPEFYDKYEGYTALPSLEWVNITPRYKHLSDNETGVFNVTVTMPSDVPFEQRYGVKFQATNNGNKSGKISVTGSTHLRIYTGKEKTTSPLLLIGGIIALSAILVTFILKYRYDRKK